MTRLYVVEQSGLEPGGHYQAYTGCVVDGARRLGLDPVVLANKRLRGSGAALPPEIIPCFTYTWAEAELHGKLGWEEGNIAYEMFDAFRRVPPEPEDHVFLHTTGYRELRALLDCLTGKLPGERLPFFHLLLRRDPDVLIENYRDYADHFARIAASEFLRRKILLHTDTHLLSEAFADVCRVPFATAPIPFEQSLLRRSLAERGERQPGDPLTIVYLGDAREEKGYQYLPQALSHLWRDYIEPGRVRFVLQSNFNTPGGEPGILSASQNLAGFLHTVLKREPLPPPEYYEILAQSDIVLIPYSAQRYRYRSSGVLVEAMGAGKVIVTSAGSWMATQVAPDHAVLFDAPARLGPAIAEAVDRFDELSAGAAARGAAALSYATGENLVRHLLAAAAPPAGRRRAGRRVLFVMNGDAMVLDNGASRVAHAQLQYLAAAGFDVVGLFLSLGMARAPEDFAKWRTALARSIAPFALEQVFVAGPGGRAFDPDQQPEIRDQRQRDGAPLQAEFDFVAGFEFGGALLRFLRTHRIDAVLLNYITNFPVVDALGLEDVPVICEMHDLQSFQRAIYGQRLVDEADLEVEFGWLERCAALVSLNPRETAIVRERLPDAVVETTGVVLPAPPSNLASLAGAKDLAEVVSSAGPILPEYRFEVAWEINKIDSVERLIAAGSLDLLYVSSAHAANVSGLRWFLSQVYEPYLAGRQISMIVAGSICRAGDWPRHPRLFFIDQVDNLAPLYAAARIVVLPITEGAGSPVKTYEALAYGRPIVGTSHAFRGLAGEPGEFIQCDEPDAFAEAVLDLLDSRKARQNAARRAREAAARLNDFARYCRTMDRVFARVLPGSSGAATPPEPREQDREAEPYVEWPGALQSVSRVLRSYFDGEPLENAALELLSEEDEDTVEALLDDISRSLLERRDAAVLQTEQRLKRYLGNPLGSRLRADAVFAVRLALAGRRASPPAPIEAGVAPRFIVCGGLPLTIAAVTDQADRGEFPLRVDGRTAIARRQAEATGLPAGAQLLHTDIPVLEGGGIGLRAIEIEAASPGAAHCLALLRQSIRFSPSLRVLEQHVFGGGFAMREDASGADLAPGASGRLVLPRISDGRHPGYVDLCFAQDWATADPVSARTVSVMLDNRPAEIDPIAHGDVTVIRVSLGVHSQFGDFGTAALTITNRGAVPLGLVAAHSGLLLGAVEQAEAAATALSAPGPASDRKGGANLTRVARAAVADIIGCLLPDAPGLNALRAVSLQEAGRDTLRALIADELARVSGLNGGAASRLNRGTRHDAANGAAAEADAVLGDILAIVSASSGEGDDAGAIVSPALPIEIVDENGTALPAQTAAATGQRGRSWLVAPLAEEGQRIRVSLDASLDPPGYPGLIEAEGFHPLESPGAGFRWTGPEPISTIALPVMLDRPARLVVELGVTGKNSATADFSLACNGKPLLHTMEARDGGATLTADVSADPSSVGVLLSLEVRHTSQVPPDRRVLGVVFRSVALLLDGRVKQRADRRGRMVPGHNGAARPSRHGEAPPSPAGQPGGRTAVADTPLTKPGPDRGANATEQASDRPRAAARSRRGRDPHP